MNLGLVDSKMRQLCRALDTESLGSGQCDPPTLGYLTPLPQLPYLQNEVPRSTYPTMAGVSIQCGDGPCVAHADFSFTKCQLRFLWLSAFDMPPPFATRFFQPKSLMVSVDRDLKGFS